MDKNNIPIDTAIRCLKRTGVKPWDIVRFLLKHATGECKQREVDRVCTVTRKWKRIRKSSINRRKGFISKRKTFTEHDIMRKLGLTKHATRSRDLSNNF